MPEIAGAELVLLKVRRLSDDQPVFRGEPRLSEPDLLLSGRLLAASQ